MDKASKLPTNLLEAIRYFSDLDVCTQFVARLRWTGGKDKAMVAGVLQRGGEVRAMVVPDRKHRSLHATIRENVEPGSAVYTDGLLSYSGLDDDYAHATIDHAVQYVDGKVHTNGIE